MMAAFLVCAIGFLPSQPIPGTLKQLYSDAFACSSMPMVANTPAHVPLTDINRYFPAIPRQWPVLSSSNPTLRNTVLRWRSAGVQPGVMLPTDVRKVLVNRVLLDRLKSAVNAGALPIAPLAAPSLHDVQAARYIWCLAGICPAAWYVPGGLSPDLALLPVGVYLIRPHWAGNPSLPLPNRPMRLWGKTILPLHATMPPAGGVTAVLDPGRSASAFTPTVDMRWHWFGITFKRTNSGVRTNLLGKAFLVGGGLSVRTWAILDSLRINLLFLLSSDFSWLVLVLGLFNLLVLILMFAWRRRAPGDDGAA